MREYRALIKDILDNGEFRRTRNGITQSVFGRHLTFDMQDGFPIVTGRKINWEAVDAEFRAFLNKPTHLNDFEKEGCHYWKKWADPQGNLKLDYGNKWVDWNGTNQIEAVAESLRDNPTDRRMIISGWDPTELDNLSLPCCHILYQFYVRESRYLDMIWYQRSVDTMVGLPHDIVMAGIFVCYMCAKVGYKYKPGRIHMMLGDTHIYEVHYSKCFQYLNTQMHKLPSYYYYNNKLKLKDYVYETEIPMEVLV